MIISAANLYGANDKPPVSLRCPTCRQQGTFDDLSGVSDVLIGDSYTRVAVRRCPNLSCRQLVFLVTNRDASEILHAFPPEVIDFDATGLPQKVIAALEEAVTCHAVGCYVASGMLVRKTLEALCEDQQAKGKTLNDRIKDLQGKVILPAALFEALDDLRLLGNDAAHIEAKTFDDIGREEVELGISLTKEILKAVYQLSDLLAKLRAQKKP